MCGGRKVKYVERKKSFGEQIKIFGEGKIFFGEQISRYEEGKNQFGESIIFHTQNTLLGNPS